MEDGAILQITAHASNKPDTWAEIMVREFMSLDTKLYQPSFNSSAFLQCSATFIFFLNKL